MGITILQESKIGYQVLVDGNMIGEYWESLLSIKSGWWFWTTCKGFYQGYTRTSAEAFYEIERWNRTDDTGEEGISQY